MLITLTDTSLREKAMKRALIITLSAATAAVAAAALFAPHYAEKYTRTTVDQLFAQARANGAKVATYKDVTTNLFRREVVLTGVELESEGGSPTKMTLDTLRVTSPWMIGDTISASTITAQNVRISAGNYVSTLPAVNAEGFALRNSGKNGGPVKSFLRNIGARSITAAEWKTQEQDAANRLITGLTIMNLNAGKAEQLLFDTISGTAKLETDETATFKSGKGIYENIDFAALAAAYVEKGDENSPVESMINHSTIENIDVTISNLSGNLKIARLKLDDMKGRPLKISLADFATINRRLEGRTEISPEDSQLLATAVTDMFNAFSVGEMSIAEIDSSLNETPVKIAHTNFSKLENARFGKINIQKIDGKGKDSAFSLGDITITDLDFAPSLKFMQVMADELAGKSSDAAISVAIYAPTFTKLGFSSFAAEAKNTGFTIESLAVDTPRHLNGIPLQLDFRLKGLKATNTDYLGYKKALKDAGFNDIVMDYGLSYTYDDAAKKLDIGDIMLNIKEAASLTYKGSFRGVEKDLLGGIVSEKFMDQLSKVELDPATVTLKDAGLTKKLIKVFAKMSGMPEETLRPLIKEQVIDINQTVLNNALDEQSMTAINSFLDAPKSLVLSFEPKQRIKAVEAYVAYEIAPASLVPMFNIRAQTAQ